MSSNKTELDEELQLWESYLEKVGNFMTLFVLTPNLLTSKITLLSDAMHTIVNNAMTLLSFFSWNISGKSLKT